MSHTTQNKTAKAPKARAKTNKPARSLLSRATRLPADTICTYVGAFWEGGYETSDDWLVKLGENLLDYRYSVGRTYNRTPKWRGDLSGWADLTNRMEAPDCIMLRTSTAYVVIGDGRNNQTGKAPFDVRLLPQESPLHRKPMRCRIVQLGQLDAMIAYLTMTCTFSDTRVP